MSVSDLGGRLNGLEYIIIPGNLHHQPGLEALHQEAFNFWKTFWNDVFIQNGCPGDLNEDSFLRQNMICLLKSKDEIAAMHLYSFYNLESQACLNHSYIRGNFNEDYISKLRLSGIKYAMSLEYLTVNPNWRKRNVGVSLGDICAGLSGEVLKSVNYDSSIAPSRSDVGVTSMARDIGGEIVVAGIELHKTMCDLIAIRKSSVKNHPNADVNRWVRKFWNQRQDHTGLTLSNQFENQLQKVG